MSDRPVVADVTQTFYDSMASQYDKFYLNWNATTKEEAVFLDGIFQKRGFDRSARVLDCACGIGTQAIGLAALGYSVTASDIMRLRTLVVSLFLEFSYTVFISAKSFSTR